MTFQSLDNCEPGSF